MVNLLKTPCGVTPPPPHLELGDLWLAFRTVSFDSGKGVSVQSLISGVLADLGGILAGPWRTLAILAGFGPKLAETWNVKTDAEMQQKICKNVMSRVPKTIRIHEKSIKIRWIIHSKSIQNRPKWHPGALQKRSWKQVGFRTAKMQYILWKNTAF